MLDTPILYLIFNRPDLTKITFESICNIKPRKLFIAADGPRLENSSDELNCMIVREYVLSKINWTCELHILFRDENLGCGKAVSSAISWFFNNVDEGIILEDDCLPDYSFYRFCSELLQYHRNNERVMSISGSNLLGNSWCNSEESYLWGFGGIWGWATWKRAWIKYDFKMNLLKDENSKCKLKKYFKNSNWFNYYYSLFKSVDSFKVDTWDAQWLFSIAISDGLCINPSVNLVQNLGFNQNATHTKDANSFMNGLFYNSINFPLVHPKNNSVNKKYLRLLFNKIKDRRKMLFYKYLNILFRKTFKIK